MKDKSQKVGNIGGNTDHRPGSFPRFDVVIKRVDLRLKSKQNTSHLLSLSKEPMEHVFACTDFHVEITIEPFLQHPSALLHP